VEQEVVLVVDLQPPTQLPLEVHLETRITEHQLVLHQLEELLAEVLGATGATQRTFHK
jgi:hypothetical protein